MYRNIQYAWCVTFFTTELHKGMHRFSQRNSRYGLRKFRFIKRCVTLWAVALRNSVVKMDVRYVQEYSICLVCYFFYHRVAQRNAQSFTEEKQLWFAKI